MFKIKSLNKNIYSYSLLPLCFVFFILSGIVAPDKRPLFKISKQESASTFNASFLHFFDLGIKRIYTDILWIQTLLEADLEHYKDSDDNSWMFHRFHTISLLDPKFIENYWYGGQYLSVVKDDDIGAKILFERGLQIYPDDFYLLYYTGSHYLLELHDKKKALENYEKIFNHPKTPSYIRGLISRLKSEMGYLEESFLLMNQLYETAPKDSPLKKAYRKRLYSIRAEIDLECLNNQKEKCRHIDLFGNPYIQRDGVYKSQIKWEKQRTYPLSK